MRLIDAYALIAEMHNIILEDGEDRRIFYEVIERQPTIEPERKTGKWIKKSKPLDLCTEWWYECSECGSKPPNDRYGHPNCLTDFCPNCGAKMNGGQTNE